MKTVCVFLNEDQFRGLLLSSSHGTTVSSFSVRGTSGGKPLGAWLSLLELMCSLSRGVPIPAACNSFRSSCLACWLSSAMTAMLADESGSQMLFLQQGSG